MSDEHNTFTHKTHLNKMPLQQNYSQLPIRKEVDDEGRIFGVVLPETPAQPPLNGNYSEQCEIPQDDIKTDEIKTEQDDISDFMENAQETFMKVSNKEIDLKRAADILGRPI